MSARPCRSLLALLVAVMAGHPAAAEVREIMQLAQTEPAIDEQTLVVFDIDNTLLEPVQTLGSDQWFYYLVDQGKRERRLSENKAIAEAVATWNRVQEDVIVRPVEPDTPALVRRLQERGVRIIALTARTSGAAAITERQLRSIGIDLGRNPLPRPAVREGRRPDTSQPWLGAILFLGENQTKGEALAKVVRSLPEPPSRVVFVDDKAHNTRSVDRALARLRIPVVAFRYGATDARVAAFDPAVAEVQLRWWRRILSDQAARDLDRCSSAPASSAPASSAPASSAPY
ncbi:MAG: DUF2608 domain-containing protein [Deltaproteobacteria bacterium]|nr:DUF2608 domain-containing protein [Deltaproteobacteria bacterium]